MLQARKKIISILGFLLNGEENRHKLTDEDIMDQIITILYSNKKIYILYDVCLCWVCMCVVLCCSCEYREVKGKIQRWGWKGSY